MGQQRWRTEPETKPEIIGLQPHVSSSVIEFMVTVPRLMRGHYVRRFNSVNRDVLFKQSNGLDCTIAQGRGILWTDYTLRTVAY